MYLEHFGFLEQPFGATPDPKFLYFGAEHAEALASLHYGLVERRGFLVLIARPGMGKTTLLFHLLERWKERAETAFVFHPPETREQMIAAVLQELGLASASGYAEGCRLLHALAIECRRKGKRLLLIFDEAQSMTPALLEQIRLLTNFETPEEKLIEIILAGQPALAERLAAPECEQLRQRVAICAHIRELNAAEVRRYVEHRLRVAGHKRRNPFTKAALSSLAQASEGIPRNINAICFEALSSACAEGKKKIGERQICRALPQLDNDAISCPPSRPPHRFRWVTGAAAAVLMAAVLLARFYLRNDSWTAPPSLLWPTALVSTAPAVTVPLPADTIVAAPAVSPGEAEEASIADTAPEPPALETPPGEPVQVQRSETLRKIALRKYGQWNPRVFEQIRKENPWLTDPDKVRAGQTLILPSWESFGETTAP